MPPTFSLKQKAIVVFCLWHMFAVAAYLLPGGYTDSVGIVMKHLNRLSMPYVLSLSQWQKWDIFSPDPLRRITDYRIERDAAADRWEVGAILDFEHLSWVDRAKELKVLGRLEYGWERLTAPYLLATCPRIAGSTGKEIRLIGTSRILPSDLPTLRRLSEVRLTSTTKILGTVRCPVQP